MRASKILDALRDLKEEEAREKIELGLAEARRRDSEAHEAYQHLAEALVMTKAATIDGLFAKAQLIRHLFADADVVFNLKERVCRLGPDDDENLAISVACDLIAPANTEART
jgi:hypothetical protein